MRSRSQSRSERYLFYTTYCSGHAGLSNGMMSLEVAVVLAALSDRVLVLEGNVSPTANVVEYDRPTSGPASKLTDLVEMPVRWLEAADVELDQLDGHELSDVNLMYAVLVFPSELEVTSDDFKSFARDRTRVLTIDAEHSDTQVLRLSGGAPVGAGRLKLGNFTFYSYFFYLDQRARETMVDTLRAMKPRQEYAELASQIAAELGTFNAAHIRRGDFKVTTGVTTLDRTPEHALETMEAHFDPGDPLVILTDEMSDPFFDGIRQRYPDALFMDEYVLDRFGRELESLPRRDPIAIAFLSQLIAAESRDFIGSMTSTFSSMIQRYRGSNGKHEPFKFLWNEIPDEGDELRPGRHKLSDCVPLDRGIMVEEYEGPYSWNRFNQRINPAWMREWPESFLPPHRPAERAASRSHDAGERRGRGVLASLTGGLRASRFDRGSSRKEPIYSLVCTDAHPSAQWQTEFLEHTWAEVGQPGELVRLFAAEECTPLPEHPQARVVRTSPRNTHPETGDAYMPYNRLYSIAEWLERERPEGTVLILDCDYAFRSPIRELAAPGRPAAQEWHAFSLSADALDAAEALSPGSAARVQPVTWPARIHSSDLARLIPRWIELTAGFRERLGIWESDMFAFALASAELGLTYSLETLGAWMNWPEEFVAGAPIIHYCQAVEATDGSTLFWKRDYTPWQRLDVDPNAAKLDYCRDLLLLLQEFIATKPEARGARQPKVLTAAERAGGEARARDERRVFVQIAAYRDSELAATIASALEHSSDPDQLRFGICWQTDGSDEDAMRRYLADDRFRIDRVAYRTSEGACWARHRIGKLYDGEPYTLQVDAHSRFAPEWDGRFIEMLSSCDVENPLLTTYPPGYQPEPDGSEQLDAAGMQTLVLERIDRSLVTRQRGVLVPDDTRPGPSMLLGAGLIFTFGEFCRDVPYDPELYFQGEEIAMAARAYTHGYTLLYPCENLVWHHYKHANPQHWDDHEGHVERDAQALARLRILLLGDPDSLGAFGLGTRRTLAEFEQHTGIDFASAAHPGPGDVVRYLAELELNTHGLEARDDDFWVFVLMDEDEHELYRSDIVDPDVLSCRRRRITIDTELARRPSKYLLWPKSRDGTWGERRVLDLPPV